LQRETSSKVAQVLKYYDLQLKIAIYFSAKTQDKRKNTSSKIKQFAIFILFANIVCFLICKYSIS